MSELAPGLQKVSSQSARSSVVRLLPIVGLAAWLFVLASLAALVRPTPFSTADDALPYFLPLIKTHTDAVLRGELPWMFWSMGQGWSPWESGQVGVVYPLYLLANVIARLTGEPLHLLEVSGWMHLFIAGWLVLRLLPTSVPGPERVLWALLATAQPAALLLGSNWHNYLAAYPWMIGLALTAQTSQLDGWRRSSKLLVLSLLSLALFLSAHPQIWALSVALTALLMMVTHPSRAGLNQVVLLGFAQLPVIVPALYVGSLAAGAADEWMVRRGETDFVLTHAQRFTTVLKGTFTGAFGADRMFRAWQSPSSAGAAMFYFPAALALLPRLTRRSGIGVTLLFALVFAAMSAKSLPLISALFPLGLGFRWTWKLSLFLFPLFGTWLAVQRGQPGSARLKHGLLVTWLVGCVAVSVDGLRFDLMPRGEPVAVPVTSLVDETRRLLEQAGVPPGARLAVVDEEARSVRWRGLIPNAQVLAGYASAHVYEPLENAKASEAHLGLNVPWRRPVSLESWKDDRRRVESSLRRLGVDAVVSPWPLGAGQIVVKDDRMRPLYVVRLQPNPSEFEPLPGGKLRAKPSVTAPEMAGRSMNWTRQPDGSWVGDPVLFSAWWGVATAAGVAVWSLLFVWLWRRERRSAAQP